MQNNMAVESSSSLFNRVKPYAAVVLLQFGYAGIVIIAKFAQNQGMNNYIFVVYRHVVATAVFAPFALLFERKVRPRMTFSTFIKILLLGLLEPVLDQNLYYTGMKYTTATFTAAMSNILPASTFLMAWILRLEKVNLRRRRSQAKVLGTVVTVSGAMLMTMIKGPVLLMPWIKGGNHHDQAATSDATYKQDPVKGALMISAGCVCWACFVILQAITLKSYPAELSLTALICMAGLVESTILTLVVERGNTAIWSLHFDSIFLAVLYSGIVCSGLAYYIQGMIMKEKGPVFVTSFAPLSMVIVAILGSIILAEQMFLGRVIGAIVIVIGLYLVIWGKSKDQQPPSKPVGDLALPTINNDSSKIDSSNQVIRVVPTDEAV